MGGIQESTVGNFDVPEEDEGGNRNEMLITK